MGALPCTPFAHHQQPKRAVIEPSGAHRSSCHSGTCGSIFSYWFRYPSGTAGLQPPVVPRRMSSRNRIGSAASKTQRRRCRPSTKENQKIGGNGEPDDGVQCVGAPASVGAKGGPVKRGGRDRVSSVEV